MNLLNPLRLSFKRILNPQYVITDEKRAILCIIDTGKKTIDEEIQETLELCKTAGVAVVDTVIQARDTPDPKYGFGKGKLKTLIQKSRSTRCGSCSISTTIFHRLSSA
jgi:GTP-binding protein HflX